MPSVRTLVAGTDRTWTEPLAEIARDRGHEVARAGGPDETVAALEGGAFDILVAVSPPPATASTRPWTWLRDRAPDAAPYVLVVNAGGEAAASAALDAGARDYVEMVLFDPTRARARLVAAEHAVVDRARRRAAEASLRESEERFRTLAEATFEAVAIHDKGVIVDANPAFAAMFGYDPAEVPGLRVLDLAAPESRGLVLERIRAGSEEPYEAFGLRKDGTKFAGELHGKAFPLRGRTVRVTAVRDVTARRQADEMRQRLLMADRLATVGRLAAAVGHEINNPLSYVLLNLQRAIELLDERPGGELGDVHETVAAARAGADRVGVIARALRSLARADEPARGPVDVRAAIESAIAMAWSDIRHRARLDRRYESVPVIVANEARLGQVFLNLLVNAAQSIPEGAPARQRIAVTTRTDEEGWAVVEVSDTGTGVPPDIAGRIFEPFFTTKAPGAGTGLGLAICREIVEDLGGRIEVESAATGGATFRVRLPGSAPAPAVDAAASVPFPPGAGARARVLIVDDQPEIGESLRRCLPEHDVHVATSGRQGLERILADEWDVVLCDLGMPDTTGMDLYDAVRRERPGAEDRIVFMTAGAFTDRARRFVSEVPNATLDKPLVLDELRRIVAERVRRDPAAGPDAPPRGR